MALTCRSIKLARASSASSWPELPPSPSAARPRSRHGTTPAAGCCWDNSKPESGAKGGNIVLDDYALTKAEADWRRCLDHLANIAWQMGVHDYRPRSRVDRLADLVERLR